MVEDFPDWMNNILKWLPDIYESQWESVVGGRVYNVLKNDYVAVCPNEWRQLHIQLSHLKADFKEIVDAFNRQPLEKDGYIQQGYEDGFMIDAKRIIDRKIKNDKV